jgi:hypothetical protein
LITVCAIAGAERHGRKGCRGGAAPSSRSSIRDPRISTEWRIFVGSRKHWNGCYHRLSRSDSGRWTKMCTAFHLFRVHESEFVFRGRLALLC